MDNVENVFEFNEGIDLSDRNILLVDEVMTTGASLCACSTVLLSNDAKNVDLATIAAGGK
jgi:predicted amidophosphoribosyltransferase